MVARKVYYGWYSVKQARIGGTCLYKTADGKTVEVSCVTSKPEHQTNWDDIAYVGEVTECVKTKSGGETEGLEEFTPENVEKLRAILEREAARKEEPFRWN